SHNRLIDAGGPARGEMDYPGAAIQSADVNQHRAASICELPQIGRLFASFHLIEELGRGAFGCVYLARQSGLANRPVALKISRGPSVEPERLAQLQHANIVPIYSRHEHGGFEGVCMP